MAASKFKPKASSNIIEGATPVEEQEVVKTEEEVVETAPVEEVEETTPTVTFEEKTSKEPVQKNVKVRLKTNHSCVVGGVAYHFEKGKLTNVPLEVKSILLQADLLMPI